VSSVEFAFGDERHCRICGREEELHDKGDHAFVPKIGAVKDVVDEREVMREEQYLCIHENRLCIKRVMSGASGENVSYETSLPPWEYEFSEALFARGRILEFLEFVNDRLSKERREHEQIAECVKRMSKQGSQDVLLPVKREFRKKARSHLFP